MNGPARVTAGDYQKVVMGQKRGGNLFAQLPCSVFEEVVTQLLKHDTVSVERIVSLGQVTPAGTWLEQPIHEWVLLIQGSAKLMFEADEKIWYMQPGDYMEIPAHCRHRVEWTDPYQKTVWLAVHYAAKNGTRCDTI
jgi:cupin 2 domain-containing protein